MTSVVFHVDELRKWSLLLKNVQNLLQAMDGQPLVVEVVANAEAVALYSEAETQLDMQKIQELADRGVRFVACNNALTGLKILKSQLPQYVAVVPAGVLELVLRQQQGYAYLKP